jgi:hypothetical protein
MRLLPWLLGQPEARAFDYRVRNVYGSGAQATVGAASPPIDGQAASSLDITPNPV